MVEFRGPACLPHPTPLLIGSMSWDRHLSEQRFLPEEWRDYYLLS